MIAWMGTEREGAHKGTLGVFVKCRLLTKRKALALRGVVARYRPHHVWLGGGRTNCRITKKASKALLGMGCKVYCEATAQGLKGLGHALCVSALDKVIVSVRCKAQVPMCLLELKFDNGAYVAIGTEYASNSLHELGDNNMYEQDKLIYKGGKLL